MQRRNRQSWRDVARQSQQRNLDFGCESDVCPKAGHAATTAAEPAPGGPQASTNRTKILRLQEAVKKEPLRVSLVVVNPQPVTLLA